MRRSSLGAGTSESGAGLPNPLQPITPCSRSRTRVGTPSPPFGGLRSLTAARAAIAPARAIPPEINSLETSMDIPDTGRAVSEGAGTRVAAQLVDDTRRLGTLPRYF